MFQFFWGYILWLIVFKGLFQIPSHGPCRNMVRRNWCKFPGEVNVFLCDGASCFQNGSAESQVCQFMKEPFIEELLETLNMSEHEHFQNQNMRGRQLVVISVVATHEATRLNRDCSPSPRRVVAAPVRVRTCTKAIAK